MTDDDDEIPEFPWLMAVPAVAWIAHGLLLLGFVGWVLFYSDFGDIGLLICTTAVLVPSALSFLVGGYRIIAGHDNVLGSLVSGLYCLFYLNIILTNREVTDVAMILAILVINIIITINNNDAWQRWANYRRSGPKPL